MVLQTFFFLQNLKKCITLMKSRNNSKFLDDRVKAVNFVWLWHLAHNWKNSAPRALLTVLKFGVLLFWTSSINEIQVIWMVLLILIVFCIPSATWANSHWRCENTSIYHCDFKKHIGRCQQQGAAIPAACSEQSRWQLVCKRIQAVAPTTILLVQGVTGNLPRDNSPAGNSPKNLFFFLNTNLTYTNLT